MDKATKIAAEKYPHGIFDGGPGDSLRAACAIGYMQAEKDLALTWEDVAAIYAHLQDVFKETRQGLHEEWSAIDMFEEILKRFNEQRKK